MVLGAIYLGTAKFEAAINTFSLADMNKGVQTTPINEVGLVHARAHSEATVAFRGAAPLDDIRRSFGFVPRRGEESGIARSSEPFFQEDRIKGPRRALDKRNTRSLIVRGLVEVRACKCGDSHDDTMSAQPACHLDGSWDRVKYKSEFYLLAYDADILVVHLCGSTWSFSVNRCDLAPPATLDNPAVLHHFAKFVTFRIAPKRVFEPVDAEKDACDITYTGLNEEKNKRGEEKLIREKTALEGGTMGGSMGGSMGGAMGAYVAAIATVADVGPENCGGGGKTYTELQNYRREVEEPKVKRILFGDIGNI